MTDANKIATVTLDMDLDSIEDLPQFLQLPTGAYVVVLEEGIVYKTIPVADGEQPIFELPFTVKEVSEVSPDDLDEDEEMPKVGDKCSFAYQADSKFGAGLFKQAVDPIAKYVGSSQIGVIMEASKGLECGLVVVRKYNKKKDKNYSSIKKLIVT